VTDHAKAFGFREWPFRVVVDEAFSQVWADRAKLKREIERRLAIIRELPHSTFQLMWADLGAGKSHTLRHIEGRCARSEDLKKLIPIYTEVPSDLEGLTGLFQKFAASFPESVLLDIGRQIAAAGMAGGGIGARDLRQALKLMGTGGASEIGIARDWLAAEPGVPNLRLLKSYNINSRIDDDGRIVEVLTELIRLVHATQRSVLWMLDEYQRIAELVPRRRESLSQGFVSLFNKCTAGLHLILSFSVAQQSAVSALIPASLLSRASLFPMLSLPYLTKEESGQFISDLLAAFRFDGQNRDKCFPFSDDAFDLVLDSVESLSKAGITPRSIMEILSQLLFVLYDASNGDPDLPIRLRECESALEQLAADA